MMLIWIKKDEDKQDISSHYKERKQDILHITPTRQEWALG
jgi:hypothetical protein